jgi:transposase
MYVKRGKENLKQVHFMCLEDLVPGNHLLREIDEAIDWKFIYDEVQGLYKEEIWGKPGIDPVSLIKIVMLQYIYGIPSMRQTIREIEVNAAYRWFIGYDIGEPVPHFTTFGKNYTRRFAGTDVFERIFARILQEAANCGFVDAKAIFIDGTHIKANANKKKYKKVEVEAPVKNYKEQLEAEINADREAHGKKPLRDEDNSNDEEPPKSVKKKDSTSQKKKKQRKEAVKKTVKQSTTDPESGMFVKGEHEKQLAYVANTACDKHNFILDFIVGAGNINDSVMFDALYAKVIEKHPEVEAVAVDAGYKTPWIMKQIIDSERIPCTPYKRPMTKDGFFKKYEYAYDEYYDCYVCPNNQVLSYSTTNREGYREYKSDPKVCVNCPMRRRCTESKACQKLVTRHVWDDYMELAEDYRYTPDYKEIYERRKETIERVFADAKEKHGMRYTRLRGLQKVRMQVTLTFACMNLKKLAKWKRKNPMKRTFSRLLCFIFSIMCSKSAPCRA